MADLREYAGFFDAAVAAALAGATVVTENTRASRQVMAACQQRLQAQRPAWETPDVLPFDAWLQRTWQDRLLSGATSLVLLRPLQQHALWERIIAAAGIPNVRAVAAEAAEAWDLLHQYGIELSREGFKATTQTRSFYEWARSYQTECRANGWADQARIFLTGEIGARITSQRIVFYGFDALTPQRQRLESALVAAGTSIDWLPHPSRAVFWRERVGNVLCVSADDPRAELHAAARWARTKLLANSQARVAVIVPQLGQLRADAEWIFTRVLHPEALYVANLESPRAFDISLGPELSAWPMIAAALRIVDLAIRALSTYDAGALIRSPYLDGGQVEAERRGIFDAYLRGVAGAEITIPELLAACRDERNPAGGLELERRLQQLQLVTAQLPAALRPSQWVDRIGELLKAMGWPGDRPLSSAEHQACDAWSELLAQFAALDLLVPTLSPAEAVAELARQAGAKLFTPENVGAPVQIMGPLEAAGSIYDHLWFCGLSDDVWPPRGRPNPLLPLKLQRAAGVPHCHPAQEFDYARRITARLAASADEVVFSWPKREEDRELRPSPLLAGIAEASTDDICGAPVISPAEQQRGVQLEIVTSDNAPPFAGPEVRGGTNVFKLQSNCPFRAFAEIRLGSRKLEDPETGIRARERGQVVEKALELVWDELREQFTLLNPPVELRGIIAGAVTKAMELLPPITAPWQARYRTVERERLIRLIQEWLEAEKARSEFRVVQHQKEVRITAGGISVNGRIDRLDRLTSGALVILDYKTGGGNFSAGLWSGARPEQPQLQLYTLSQLKDNKDVAGVAFALVRTCKCRLHGLAESKEILGRGKDQSGKYLNGASFAEHIAGWQAVLDALGEQFRAGVATVDPYPERVCDNCHLHALCRINEIAPPTVDEENAEADNEAEA